jgi:hypothetical protein
MSQRISGFKRLPSEGYDTIEAWPVRALLTQVLNPIEKVIA